MNLNDLLDRLAALPRSQRLAAFAGVGVLIIVLFIFLVFLPAREDIARLEKDVAELTKERDEVKKRAENREAYERELTQLTAQLGEALKEMPDSREIPDLLKRISTVAKKAGLEISKFQPLPEVALEYYAEVPIALEVTGSYHEVAMFFDRLSKLNRIVSSRNIEMKTPKDQGGKVVLSVTGKLVTYRFLSEEEQAASKAASESRGGRGAKKKGK